MDPSHYPAFKPLLIKLKPYSDLTGARFHGRSFEDLMSEFVDVPEQGTISERMRLKLESISEVAEFTKRLREEEHALMEEFHRASRLVMHEAVRQATMATIRELNLWPKDDTPVDKNDIAWEDMGADIHTVARRCYNYEKITTNDPLYSDLKSQRITGSFVVDFCTYALREDEKVLVSNPSSELIMKDFIDMVRRYQSELDKPQVSKWRRLKKEFVKALTEDGRWDKSWVQAEKVEAWWEENRSNVLIGGVLLAGLVGITAVAMAKNKR